MMNGYGLWQFIPPIILTILPLTQEYTLLANEEYEQFHIQSHESCPEGYYKCPILPQCICETLVCNGIIDCQDLSDEYLCDADEDFSYWDHMYRKQPTGFNDEIKRGDCFFKMNPNSTCTCRGYDVLCYAKGLRDIPKDLPETNIMSLDLSNNNFQNITKEFLKNVPDVVVDILILRFCNITYIATKAFARATDIGLLTLYLSENNLEYVNGPLFAENNTMEALILSGNRIKSFHSNAFKHLDLLEELDLRNNLIEVLDAEVFRYLTSIKQIYLNNNRLKHFTTSKMSQPISVSEVSLVDNLIEFIDERAFPFKDISHLYLSNNRLTELPAKLLCNLVKLQELMVQNNSLRNIDVHTFDCVKFLESLDFSDNDIQFLDMRVLQNTKLALVNFEHFKLCQSVPHAYKCFPSEDAISNEKNLLEEPILREVIWRFAKVAIIGNIIVLLHSFFEKRNHSTCSFALTMFLRSLAVCDLMMGIYLVIISNADENYRDEYLEHGYEWRYGNWCSFAGFLNTFSSIASMLLLVLNAVERINSLSASFLNGVKRRAVYKRFAFVWALSFLLAAFPLLPLQWYGYHFYGGNSVCLPLYLDDPHAGGSMYSFFLFVFLNMFAVMFNFLIHVLAGRNFEKPCISRRYKISLIVSSIVYVLLLHGEALRRAKILDVLPCFFRWQVVFIYPIKCVINPIVYIMFTLYDVLIKDRDYLAIFENLMLQYFPDDNAIEEGQDPDTNNDIAETSFIICDENVTDIFRKCKKPIQYDIFEDDTSDLFAKCKKPEIDEISSDSPAIYNCSTASYDSVEATQLFAEYGFDSFDIDVPIVFPPYNKQNRFYRQENFESYDSHGVKGINPNEMVTENRNCSTKLVCSRSLDSFGTYDSHSPKHKTPTELIRQYKCCSSEDDSPKLWEDRRNVLPLARQYSFDSFVEDYPKQAPNTLARQYNLENDYTKRDSNSRYSSTLGRQYSFEEDYLKHVQNTNQSAYQYEKPDTFETTYTFETHSSNCIIRLYDNDDETSEDEIHNLFQNRQNPLHLVRHYNFESSSDEEYLPPFETQKKSKRLTRQPNFNVSDNDIPRMFRRFSTPTALPPPNSLDSSESNASY